jgi:hypothetical protein
MSLLSSISTALDGVLVGEDLEVVASHEEERQGAGEAYSGTVWDHEVLEEVCALEVALHLAVKEPQVLHGEVEGVLLGVDHEVVGSKGKVSVHLGVETELFFDTVEDVELGLRWAVARYFDLRRRCPASRRG